MLRGAPNVDAGRDTDCYDPDAAVDKEGSGAADILPVAGNAPRKVADAHTDNTDHAASNCPAGGCTDVGFEKI